MIIVGGENLVDFIQSEGTQSYQAKAGGSPFNCAMAIGRQGASVGYITPVSTDTLGDMLAETLAKSDVAVLKKRVAEPTSLAVVTLKSGVPSYQFYRENTAERQVSLGGLIASTPEFSTALHLGSLALTGKADADIWADYFGFMHESGRFTTLDPNIRPAFIHDRQSYISRLDRVMMQADLLKLSDEDLGWLYPDESVADAAEMLVARTSAKLVVVTLGSDGAFALMDGNMVNIKATPVVEFRDSVGAGDTFMASLLAFLARRDALSVRGLACANIEELLYYAASAAAANCEEDGCNPPTLEAINAKALAQNQ